MKKAYSKEHARAGVDARMPDIETFESQYRNYQIAIECPEYTSVCPKTGLPDFGKLTLRYTPDKLCLELKSFKLYLLSYRNLGVFYENAVNKILADVVKAVRPLDASLTGEFTPRGGLNSTITATYVKATKRPARKGRAE